MRRIYRSSARVPAAATGGVSSGLPGMSSSDRRQRSRDITAWMIRAEPTSVNSTLTMAAVNTAWGSTAALQRESPIGPQIRQRVVDARAQSRGADLPHHARHEKDQDHRPPPRHG